MQMKIYRAVPSTYWLVVFKSHWHWSHWHWKGYMVTFPAFTAWAENFIFALSFISKVVIWIECNPSTWLYITASYRLHVYVLYTYCCIVFTLSASHTCVLFFSLIFLDICSMITWWKSCGENNNIWIWCRVSEKTKNTELCYTSVSN